jgi:hypothetical protein
MSRIASSTHVEHAVGFVEDQRAHFRRVSARFQ